MALIVAIHDTRFSGGQNLADEESFIPFAVGKKIFMPHGNRM
jgi:hypothetical protein